MGNPFSLFDFEQALEQMPAHIGEQLQDTECAKVPLGELLDKPLNQPEELSGSGPRSLKTPEEQAIARFVPMLHGKATDAFAELSSRGALFDPIAGQTIFCKGDVTVCMTGKDGKPCTLGPSTHKLLCAASMAFTKANTTGFNNTQALSSLEVRLNLRDYATLCGYNITPHILPGMSPEEVESEKNRAENTLKNARRKIHRDLQNLFDCTVSVRAPGKAYEADFTDARLLSKKGIHGGSIVLTLSSDFGLYLLRKPLTLFPLSLLQIDERRENAYRMAYAMSIHFSMDGNQKKGTAELLRVRSLLAHTNFPTIEEVRKNDRGHWERRIKEQFERALESLVGTFLADWRYSLPQGEEMSESQAQELGRSYDVWADTLVCFTLKDPPDHTARLQAAQEARSAQSASGQAAAHSQKSKTKKQSKQPPADAR